MSPKLYFLKLPGLTLKSKMSRRVLGLEYRIEKQWKQKKPPGMKNNPTVFWLPAVFRDVLNNGIFLIYTKP